MRMLVPISLGLALAATLALAFFVLRRSKANQAPNTTDSASETAARSGADPAHPRLRPYRTTQTLTEDLRDALAARDPGALGREVWTVSRALQRRAPWMLENVAPYEASPGVRALLVLATGVHTPDSARLLAFLGDPAPAVRCAAALAAGHRSSGDASVTLMPGVAVPVGRELPAPTSAAIRKRLRREPDDTARRVLAAVLRASSGGDDPKASPSRAPAETAPSGG